MEQAEFHQHRGDIPTAKTLWSRLLADFDLPNFRLRHARFLCSVGEVSEAIEDLTSLYRSAIENGDDDLRPVVAHELATVFRNLGDRHTAASWQQISLGYSESCSPADLAGRAADAFLAGEYALADDLIRRSLAWEIQTGNRAGEAADWGTLGLIRAGQDDFEGAVRCFGRAFALHRKISDADGMATDLLNLGGIFGGRSAWQIAFRLFKRAQFVASESGNIVLQNRAGEQVQKAVKILDVAKRSPQWN